MYSTYCHIDMYNVVVHVAMVYMYRPCRCLKIEICHLYKRLTSNCAHCTFKWWWCVDGGMVMV